MTLGERWSGLTRRVTLLCALLSAAACGAMLPTQPIAAFGEGVTLYPDSLFRGDRVTVDGDVTNLRRLRGPCAKSDDEEEPTSNYDDCVSSIRVPAGWSVTVYRDRDFRGSTTTYTQDVPDLDVVNGPCRPGFNDCISSIRVSRATVP